MLLNIDPSFPMLSKGKYACSTEDCTLKCGDVKKKHLNLVVSWMCYYFHRITSLVDSTSVIISKLKNEPVISKKIIYTFLAHWKIPIIKLKIKNGKNICLFCELDSFSILNDFLGRVVVIMMLTIKSKCWYCIQIHGSILSNDQCIIVQNYFQVRKFI